MKEAIALRHVHFEDVGILDSLLASRGYRLRYIDATIEQADTAAAEQADLLIVLGGPIGAYDEGLHPFLLRELDLIARRLQQQRPILGICLGAQLIARALGAEVAPMGLKEIGYAPLDLSTEGSLSPLAALEGQPVLHWHGDQFAIPPGATCLASTPVCPHQAFSLGAHVLALQFHLEADPARINQWLVGHACELGQAGIDPRSLREQAKRFGTDLRSAAHAVMSNWLDKLEASQSALS